MIAKAKLHGWRIAKIAIRQFRGVAGEQTYSFDGRSGLLHGDNGVGKSTLPLALQWVLYGRFPSGVLQNTTFDRFLAPVGQKAKSYSGEVVFTRGDETLVLRRGEDGLALEQGGATVDGDEAASKRDALLGLDMDTFVRAVVLQQSRIRGLLLDEAKERNKTLDRLLGMDVVEQLVAIVRPKEFESGAVDARAAIEVEKRAHEAKEKLLAEQLAKAQDRARELDFKNKDLNPTGLATRYAEVGDNLAVLAKKNQVEVEPLPGCSGIKEVAAAQRVFAKGVKTIRLESQLKKRAAPVEQRIAVLASLGGRWKTGLKARDDGRVKLATLIEKHGETPTLLDEKKAVVAKAEALKGELKAASALRELLADARAFVQAPKPSECPVCEQALPAGLDLRGRLGDRVSALASEEIVKLDAAIAKVRARIVAIDEALAALAAAQKELARAQKELDELREKVVEALDSGVAENKVAKRLEEELAKDEAERAKLKTALEALEEELHALSAAEGVIREGLVPVLQKRDEIAAHEKAKKTLAAKHAAAEAKAAALERTASHLDAIKKALLDAKKDVATELLKKAAPRAQDLYGRLVRHRVFDTLDVRADAKAAKVDYAFAVQSGAKSGTSREARLVLSDGQLTATALALFFGLAESTAHHLDVLFVDDPTQNLDLPSKEAMAKVVVEVAAHRQVIVATQDEDFVSYLKSEGFGEDAVVHHIKSWDGDPTIETATPDGAATS